MPGRKRPKRVFHTSVYCRYRGSVLLVQDRKTGVWAPIGGRMKANETPIEAATRLCSTEAGVQPYFPRIHSLTAAPEGLLLYEEFSSSSGVLHLNFAFVAEIPHRKIQLAERYEGSTWVSSVISVREEAPDNVLEALAYALTAGIRRDG
jgi:ADP-ribose pyrophosphatase YjhB (NUDIX family)